MPKQQDQRSSRAGSVSSIQPTISNLVRMDSEAFCNLKLLSRVMSGSLIFIAESNCRYNCLRFVMLIAIQIDETFILF